MEFSLSRSIQSLSSTPAVLEQLFAGLDDDWAHMNEGPETFSPFDVVGHLIDGEETDWIPRARIILSDSESKAFEPYDRFRHYDRNRGKDIQTLLQEFSRLRSANLAELKEWQLTETDLQKEGVHPEFGAVTLQALISAWVVHDLGHISQIVRIASKQLGNEVGPWKKYLTILH